MAAIEKIPMEMRWQIATKGLTGAYAVIAKAYKEALGEDRYNAFNGQVWRAAGKGVRELADNLGLKHETPKDIAEIMTAAAVSSMGPEFVWEIVAADKDKCVIKHSKCPWHERAEELDMGFDFCVGGHENWCAGVCESLNPELVSTLTKSMAKGDSYCETVISRKK